MDRTTDGYLGNSKKNLEDSQELDIETQIYSELAQKVPQHASEKNNYIPFFYEDLKSSTVTNEASSLPEKLDPLSKEFPFSMPNKNYNLYLNAREEVFTEVNTPGILTKMNTDTKQAERKQLRNQTAEQGCKCIVF